MKIQVTKTKSAETFYVTKTFRDPKTKKSTSKVVRRLGTRAELQERLGEDADVVAWAKDVARKMTEEERSGRRKVQISYDPCRLIDKDQRTSFNVGYLFLQEIYSELGLSGFCRKLAEERRFDFDLDQILSRLVYGRMLEPCSKRATCEFSFELAEQPTFEQHQIYRALSVLAENTERIQAHLFHASEAVRHRKTKVLYYDCTSYYFEIQQEDGFRMYGPSKEHRPSPIVGMGLMMDADGMPLAFDLYPGNESEQPTLTPLERRIIDDFGLDRFCVCTDAGLASAQNRRFNSQDGLQFVTTIPLKGQKRKIKEWAQDPQGWSAFGEVGTFDISKVQAAYDDPACPEDVRSRLLRTTFFKYQRITDTDPKTKEDLAQTLVVTFSLRYRNYQRSVRASQIQRAQHAIDTGEAKRHRKGPKDPMRFVSKTSLTQEGELADKEVFSLNEDKIAQEEAFDGLYGLATSFAVKDEEMGELVHVASGRWEVEECFEIMKSEFEARPVYLSRRDRIEAHFLICFIALLIYRILEKRLGGRFTCKEILSKLKEMRMEYIRGEGWRPLYVRDDLTDALHEAFGFRTDYELVPQKDMKDIFRMTKRPD